MRNCKILSEYAGTRPTSGLTLDKLALVVHHGHPSKLGYLETAVP